MAGATGATSGAAVQVNNYQAFVRDLRTLDQGLSDGSARLREVYQVIADRAASKSQATARNMGGMQKKGAAGIKGVVAGGRALVRISSAKRTAMAPTAFWGSKARTGWFADPLKYGAYPSQHPRWVGNTWSVATRGQGPYAINDTLADQLPEIVGDFEDMVLDMVKGMTTITSF